MDEQLVAYLDGRLDAEAARQVEQRLAAEEPVRRRLQQLAQSWDLLDQLPRSTVDENFTHTTVRIVALAAEEEVNEQESHQARRRRVRWVAGAAAVVAAAVCGFAIVSHVRPDPNEQLLTDLPVIENVDQYRHAEDIDFLRKLHDEGLFPEESGDAP